MVPEPDILVANLEKLEIFFKDKRWTSGGVPLLNQNALDELKKLKKHALNGCISDPKHVKMYYSIGKDSVLYLKSYF